MMSQRARPDIRPNLLPARPASLTTGFAVTASVHLWSKEWMGDRYDAVRTAAGECPRTRGNGQRRLDHIRATAPGTGHIYRPEAQGRPDPDSVIRMTSNCCHFVH